MSSQSSSESPASANSMISIMRSRKFTLKNCQNSADAPSVSLFSVFIWLLPGWYILDVPSNCATIVSALLACAERSSRCTSNRTSHVVSRVPS